MADAVRRMLLVRHGRTAWNAQTRAQGHSDVPLDETGHAQAAAVAPVVATYGPVLLRSSDLARAAQTADPVAAACGLPVDRDPRLREFAVGDHRVGLTPDEYAERFPDEHLAVQEGRLQDVPGRESVPDVVGRIVPALLEVAGGLGAGECAVVVSHGAALKVGLAAFLGWPATAADGLAPLRNCGVVVLEESVPTFFAGDRRWRLAGYNLG